MKELKEAILSKRFVVETSQHVPEVVEKLEREIVVLEEAQSILASYYQDKGKAKTSTK